MLKHLDIPRHKKVNQGDRQESLERRGNNNNNITSRYLVQQTNLYVWRRISKPYAPLDSHAFECVIFTQRSHAWRKTKQYHGLRMFLTKLFDLFLELGVKAFPKHFELSPTVTLGTKCLALVNNNMFGSEHTAALDTLKSMYHEVEPQNKLFVLQKYMIVGSKYPRGTPVYFEFHSPHWSANPRRGVCTF